MSGIDGDGSTESFGYGGYSRIVFRDALHGSHVAFGSGLHGDEKRINATTILVAFPLRHDQHDLSNVDVHLPIASFRPWPRALHLRIAAGLRSPHAEIIHLARFRFVLLSN